MALIGVEAEGRRQQQADPGERPQPGQHAHQRADHAADERIEEHGGRERHREAQAEVLERLRHQRPNGRGAAARGATCRTGRTTPRPGRREGGGHDGCSVAPRARRGRAGGHHGDAIAEPFERETDEGADGQDDESLARLAPAHGGDGRGVCAHGADEATEDEQDHREQHRKVARARIVPGAERQPAALPHDEDGKQAERLPRVGPSSAWHEGEESPPRPRKNITQAPAARISAENLPATAWKPGLGTTGRRHGQTTDHRRRARSRIKGIETPWALCMRSPT